MSKHTPTPWKIYDGDDSQTVCFVGSIKIVAEEIRGYDLHEEEETDAALILRAVNAYDDLIDALKLARAWMIPGMSWSDPTGLLVKAKVDAALSKHGGDA